MPPGFEARVGVQLRQYSRVTVFERIEEDVPPPAKGAGGNLLVMEWK